MSSTRAHTCVYFDDGEQELVCLCGARAWTDRATADDALLVFEEVASTRAGAPAAAA